MELININVEGGKDASVVYKDNEGETIECRVFNYWSSNGWKIGLTVFKGYADSESYFLNPTVDLKENYVINQEVTLSLGSDSNHSVILEYPSQAKLRIINLRSNILL